MAQCFSSQTLCFPVLKSLHVMFPNLETVIVELLFECMKEVVLKKSGSVLPLWFGGNAVVLLLPGGTTTRSWNQNIFNTFHYRLSVWVLMSSYKPK